MWLWAEKHVQREFNGIASAFTHNSNTVNFLASFAHQARCVFTHSGAAAMLQLSKAVLVAHFLRFLLTARGEPRPIVEPQRSYDCCINPLLFQN